MPFEAPARFAPKQPGSAPPRAAPNSRIACLAFFPRRSFTSMPMRRRFDQPDRGLRQDRPPNLPRSRLGTSHDAAFSFGRANWSGTAAGVALSEWRVFRPEHPLSTPADRRDEDDTLKSTYVNGLP